MNSIYNFYHLNIEVTNHCNQKCLYCFNNSGPDRLKSKFTFKEWKELLYSLKLRSNLESVHLTGGEPFTYPHIISLIEYCKKIGLSVSILSNGYRISEFCDLYPETLSNLNIAQISLDSMNSEYVDSVRRYEGAFLDAISAIKSLRSLNIPVEISAVVNSNTTEKDTIDLAEFASNYNCSIVFRDLENTGRGKRYIRQYLDAVTSSMNNSSSDRFCYLPSERDHGADRGIRTVLSDGEISPYSVPLGNYSMSNLENLMKL